jgi:hypothetical protein
VTTDIELPFHRSPKVRWLPEVSYTPTPRQKVELVQLTPERPAKVDGLGEVTTLQLGSAARAP